jgi:Transposase, Mutator family
VIAYGVHESGRREILGIDVGASETEAFWTEFLRSLVARGLAGVQLLVEKEQCRSARMLRVVGRGGVVSASLGVLAARRCPACWGSSWGGRGRRTFVVASASRTTGPGLSPPLAASLSRVRSSGG